MESAAPSLGALSQKVEQLRLEEQPAEAQTIPSAIDTHDASEEAVYKPFDGFLHG